MNEPSHCFVVPAYGRSPHLRECLESLQRQTRSSTVVVCSSTPYEGLRELVEAFGARLHVHSPNRGIGHDWNAALSQARASWVTIAHQDDVYLPRFTERTLAMAAEASDASILFTGYAELLHARQRIHTPMLWIKRLLLEAGFLGRAFAGSACARRRSLRFGCPIPCPSVTINLARTGLRFREDLKVNLDWDAWLRLADGPGAFGYCREALMLHRIHPDSETVAGVRDGIRAREDRMMFDRLWPRHPAAALTRLYALSYRG